MARDIGSWLEGLGLGRYAKVFADNEIDLEALPHLTDEDLKAIGVALGARRRLLAAIAELGDIGEPAIPDEASGVRHAGADAERRQLSIMFTDIVGSTELSRRLDPEDLRELMRGYQDAVAGVVARYEGHVAKFLGDGVLAYFGWPQAHEDQAERAVRAGLDAIAAVGRLEAGDAGALRARVGIATGQVVVGDLVREAGAVTGETPNLAARLQETARADQVNIGAETRRLIAEAFELEDLGRRALKGFAQPVAMWRVRGERQIESRFDAAHAGRLSDFVAREHEIGLLLDRWTQIKGGEGQVVLLSGEAGIGKSRITQMLRERIAGEPHSRVRLQCSPRHASTELHPFTKHLERAAAFAPQDTAEARLDKLERLLGGTSEGATRLAPLFASLLSLAGEERYGPLDLPPQRFKERIQEALCDQLLGLAARQPVLVLFEDAHWADPTSLEVLGQTIDRLQEAPILLVITFRPEFEPPWHGHTHVTALTLNRLSRDQCTTLIAHVSGEKGLPPEVLDQIISKTDGIPLFVEELTKAILESGLLDETAERYRLAAGPLPPLAIPSTLQDSLMARLDRLAPVKEVAQLGAAIGREFSHRVVAAVSGMSDSELSQALARLVEAGLIFRRGSSAADARYIFKHALVQDAAYATLLKSKRHQLHRRIAEALAERAPGTGEAEPEIIAHHYTEAGLSEPAVRYWRRAGERAAERSANREAIAHLTRGLELVEGLPESPKRDELELGLRLALGPVLMAVKGFLAAEAEALYARARELSERMGDAESLFTALYGLWQVNQNNGRITIAKKIADDMIRRTDSGGDSARRLQAHHCNWTTSLVTGEAKSCHFHSAQGMRLYDKEEHSTHKFVYGGHDPGVCGHGVHGVSEWLLGFPDRAVESADKSLALADDLNHPFSRVPALVFPSVLRLFRRDLPAAIELAETGAALCAEHGFGFWGPWFRVAQAFAQAQTDGGGEAIAEMRKAVDGWRATAGNAMFESWFLALRADTDRMAGRLDEGLETIAEGLALGREAGVHWADAELHRIRAELLLARSAKDRTEAERALLAAIEVARRQGARSLELRAATGLARLWVESGRRAEAHGLLAPVYDGFSEGFGTADLGAAKQPLTELP